jgi:glycosyltransferase involved in cell wall biosynthesis
MKIALVSPKYAPHIGGVETHVSELAARMAAYGHEVEVLTQEDSRRGLPRIACSNGVTVRRFATVGTGIRYPQAPGLWHHLAVRRGTYDVVHVHSYHATPALAAALAHGRILVFTPHYHGTGHTVLSRLAHVPYRAAGRFIFSRSDRIICVSRAEAAVVRRHFPGTDRRIVIIPNGVDPVELRAAAAFPVTGSILLCVGRLDVYKNVVPIILALRHLSPDYQLAIVGDGPESDHLSSVARQMGLADRVHLLGTVSRLDLCRWFQTASVFVTLSAHEAFGIAVLEAVVAGSPVVASDIPAHRELVGLVGADAITLISRFSDPSAVAKAVLKAVSGPTRLTAPVPTWDSVAQATLRVYQDLATAQADTSAINLG